MIYVYDIILNWTDEDRVYEFFEWELKDDLEHVKRMPLFKINSNRFSELIDYEVGVDKEFLDKIWNLTEIYASGKVEHLDYACLFTDGTRVIALEFSNEGDSIYRSKMLLDEEQDVTILSNKLLEYDLLITKKNKRNYDLCTTRLESEMKRVLTQEIKNSYKKGNFDKIKYLYFECFEREQEDIDIAYKKLLESMDKELNYNHSKLYEVVKLSYQNKG